MTYDVIRTTTIRDFVLSLANTCVIGGGWNYCQALRRKYAYLAKGIDCEIQVAMTGCVLLNATDVDYGIYLDGKQWGLNADDDYWTPLF